MGTIFTMKELDYTVDENGCWIYRGCKNKKGYGVVRRENRNWQAHRWQFRQKKGSLIDGQLICHSCDNPPCINPDHLWQGTPQDNVDDMISKGRTVYANSLKTHCKRNHLLAGDNLRMYNGKRICRACMKIHSKKAQHKTLDTTRYEMVG